MDDPARLARIELGPHGEDYLVRLFLSDGTSCEVIATFDQLDLLAEDIDRRLDADEV
ncbi:hypothetical protein FHR20_004114 [Sphingomonas leidyi]|uniref:Uncharacterized protein n=1 Tax=Sphingomonas leidyi TaxID=68569 RepID=A0A7X5ZXF9_9SPHN|nr:hypothetical protein [Sphingomonas leidyi]NIJ67136.1 hypothetical protein [Sphingomonas leidyi]